LDLLTRRWAGSVVFISPDSGMPAGQGMATHLVKGELAGEELEREELRGQVKLGMAGQAEIVTGQQSLLARRVPTETGAGGTHRLALYPRGASAADSRATGPQR
jgi:hypothetical protein